jgi:trimeric autotransporter adhesin
MPIVLDGSNGIQIPAGSVSNPPIRSSDADTGIFFPSSNTVAITIDGSQKVLVNANGQVDFAEPITAPTANATNLNVSGTSTFSDNVTLNSQSDLRFADSDSSNFIALQAPATISTNFTLTLPTNDGVANQALVTDGSGTLSFANVASEVDPPLPNILMLAGM